MRVMRKNKGITLIALVITIIVLLILAGVSISAITGENGIIVKAKNAKDATRVAQIEEKIKLYQSENSLLAAGNETTKTIEEFIDELEKEGMITSKEKTEIFENHTLTVGEQEPIVFPFAKTLVQAFKDGEIQIGDYVVYTPSDADATYELNEYCSYSVDTTTKWRVLGLNEEGNQLIITTANPLLEAEYQFDNSYLHLSGGNFYDCVDILNSISYLYHNEELASETRSMTIEDINNALGIVVEGNTVYKESDETKTNIDCCESLGVVYTYKSGDYAVENYLKMMFPDDPEIQKLESKKVGDKLIGTSYGYQYDDEDIIDPNSALYEVLFKGTLYEDEECAKAYWLASPGVYTKINGNLGLGAVAGGRASKGGIEAFESAGGTVSHAMAVKPVVLLKSNITVEQVLLDTGEYEHWNIENQDALIGTLIELDITSHYDDAKVLEE